MVVLVTGDRHYPIQQKRVIHDALARLLAIDPDLEVVHGDADGADFLAKEACSTLRIPCHSYPAPWHKMGRRAGPWRNRYMLKRHPEIALVLAFHDNLRKSSGTKDMIEVALSQGIQVILHENGREIELEQLSLFD